jgi:hypothetical protein
MRRTTSGRLDTMVLRAISRRLLVAALGAALLVAAGAGCDEGDDRCRPLGDYIGPNGYYWTCDCNQDNCEPWSCSTHDDCDEYSYCDPAAEWCRELPACDTQEDCPEGYECDELWEECFREV